MSTIPNYKGGIKLSGGLAPKGDGTFPLMEAHDIVVDESGKRLDEKLGELDEGGSADVKVGDGLLKSEDGTISVDKSNYRGHGTGFSYQWLQDPNGTDVNNLAREGHYFVIHGTYIPEGFDHGFLDVDYFDGESFAPHGNGKVDVIKQTFRPWNTNDIYVRTYDSRSKAWTDWKQLGVEKNFGDFTIMTEGDNIKATLTESGWYYVTATYTPSNSNLNFGVMYWDGSSTTRSLAMSIESYTVAVRIDRDGAVYLITSDGGTLLSHDKFNVYVSRVRG